MEWLQSLFGSLQSPLPERQTLNTKQKLQVAQKKQAKALPFRNTPAVKGYIVPTEEKIKQGLLAYNPKTPLATQSAALHQGMTRLSQNTNINPIDLLTFLLRESQGGLTQAGIYNPGNVRNTITGKGYYSYPDYNTAINGGWNPQYNMNSKGIVGTLLTDPRYKQYRDTGNTDYFNQTWTPQSDNNPSAGHLTATMRSLEKYFQ